MLTNEDERLLSAQERRRIPGYREAEDDVSADPQCQGLPETQRQAIVLARIGQGSYRRRMLELWKERCALTGLSVPEALVASHAKPWKDCTNEERLDEYNGLLLSATYDRLFDQGLISFADSGQILLSPELPSEELAILGLDSSATLTSVHVRHRPYLRAHRLQFGFE